MIRRGERARNRIVRPGRILRFQKNLDRLLEPPLKQMSVSLERNQPAQFHSSFVGQVKAVNRIQEEKRPHPLIQIAALPPKLLQLRSRRQKLLQGSRPANRIKRLIADARLWTGDNL